jgi:hypothetical protein
MSSPISFIIRSAFKRPARHWAGHPNRTLPTEPGQRGCGLRAAASSTSSFQAHADCGALLQESDLQWIRLSVACSLISVELTVAMAGPAITDDAVAAQYVQFVQEPAALCVERNGVQIQVKSSHPSRTVRVWLDRIHMGVGTGDRSRSDLPPGGDAQPLGCSRSLNGAQEWRVVKAEFVD